MERRPYHKGVACLAALLLIAPLLLTGCGVIDGFSFPVPGPTVREGEPLSEEQPVSYVKGTVSDGVYTNPWAGIQITVPEGLSLGSDAQYTSVAKDKRTECGLYLTDEKAAQTLFIGFQRLTGSVSAEAYLNKVTLSLREAAEKYEKMTVEPVGSFSFVNLGGNEYIKGRYLYADSGKEAYQDYYVRELDGYMIFIVCTAPAADEADALIGLVRPCN